MKENENMEIVEIDGQPVEPKEPEESKKDEEKVEKTSALKKVGRFVTAPARWVGRKLKESPASACVGGVIGGGLALGGKLAYDHFVKARRDPDEEADVDNETDNIVDFGGPTEDIDEEM